MKLLAICLSSCLLLAACVSAPPAAVETEQILHDEQFAQPRNRVGPEEVFALSDEMRLYLTTGMASYLRSPEGRHRGLLDALYTRGQLKLRYDSSSTRKAAEAFDARAGNCLSLVIMTAAFAKALDLPVRYYSMASDSGWSRTGDLYLSAGHVNLALGQRLIDRGEGRSGNADWLLVDFLPESEIRGDRRELIDEATLVAMFMNNRAVEALADGKLDEAYWFARTAVVHKPQFLPAHNTLGVIYQRRGLLREAEPVFAQVLKLEPENRHALANLARLYAEQGRADEAAAIQFRLTQIEPQPPYYFFDRGVAAMNEGRYGEAKAWFMREIRRSAYQHEFHFWLGLAHYLLGDSQQAQAHIAVALENSTTPQFHDLYAAKLEWLKARQHASPRRAQ